MKVVTAGFQTTVQDCGRFGYRKFGVTTAGALDPTALRLTNLLVGNEENAAGLEIASGRVQLRCDDARLIAWNGGDFDVRVAGAPLPRLHVATIDKSETLEVVGKHGRAWLAVSGGIDVPRVLGSRATDLRARFGGLGGRALDDGDELPLARESTTALRIRNRLRNRISDWAAPTLDTFAPTLRVVPAAHWQELDEFQVAMNSDRMGLRLTGKTLAADAPEQISEAVVAGTIQLPRGGAPIILLADCQTIGGYPKLAHVISVDLSRAAQLQPLDAVRFERTTIEVARASLRQRELDIARFRVGLEVRFA